MPDTFIRINQIHKDYPMGTVVVKALAGATLDVEQNAFSIIMVHLVLERARCFTYLVVSTGPRMALFTLATNKSMPWTRISWQNIGGRKLGLSSSPST
jgi:hypothetical protein